jgi:protein-S-isoprenylcysteine O-methyltransferase Ste14
MRCLAGCITSIAESSFRYTQAREEAYLERKFGDAYRGYLCVPKNRSVLIA